MVNVIDPAVVFGPAAASERRDASSACVAGSRRWTGVVGGVGLCDERGVLGLGQLVGGNARVASVEIVLQAPRRGVRDDRLVEHAV